MVVETNTKQLCLHYLTNLDFTFHVIIEVANISG